MVNLIIFIRCNIIVMKMIGKKLSYVWVLPSLHSILVFEMCFFGTLIFYLRHDLVGNVGEFALFLPSRGNLITVPANLV